MLKSSDLLSPSVKKLLQKPGLALGTVKFNMKSIILKINIDYNYLEEKELLKSTNPDNISIETNYQGPRKRMLFLTLMKVQKLSHLFV